MKLPEILNIKNAIILVVIASIVKLILFGLVLFGMKFFYPSFPIYGIAPLHLLSSLIIDFITIIFAIRLFNVDVKEQLNRIGLTRTFLFSLLAILISILILPLVNPISFFEKIANHRITTHQLDFMIFETPDFFNLFYFFLMVIITPIIEEILYRGIIFNLFLKKYSVIISITLSSLIFALIHLKFIGIGYLFLYGLLFGFAYYKTKSLYTPILLHVLINFMASITKVQYFELNAITLPKYFLYLIVLLTTIIIVFSSLNKGENSIKFESKLIIQECKKYFLQTKKASNAKEEI